MDATWFYALFPLCLLLLALILPSKLRNRKLPPSPVPALPVIGHLHLLRPLMHRIYHRFSEKLGPIFSLHFGTRLVVVVSSPAAAEECFTKNDIVLANRPRLMIGKYIGYNYTGLSTSPYGEHWRNLRRLTTIEIFSSARLNMFQSIRRDEIKILLGKLYQKSQHDFARVELKSLFSEFSFNIIMRMVAGKRYFGESEDNEQAKKCRKLIKEAFAYGGVSNPADFFQVLRWIDYKGKEKGMKRMSKEMDAFLQGLIDEHRRDKIKTTMIGHLLNLQESQPEYYTDSIIKGIIMALAWGGEAAQRFDRNKDASTSAQSSLKEVFGRHEELIRQMRALRDLREEDKKVLLLKDEEVASLKRELSAVEGKLSATEGRLRQQTQEIETSWVKKEEFLKTPEFESLCSDKAATYFQEGFNGCLAQFRANGYTEAEHPADFLDVVKAIEDMPEEEEVPTKGPYAEEMIPSPTP